MTTAERLGRIEEKQDAHEEINLRIEKKMDENFAAMRTTLGVYEKRLEHHEVRLSKLERFRYYLAGGMTALVGVLKLLWK